VAFDDSQWGKASPNATLNNPAVVGPFTDSNWGRTTAILEDPTVAPPTGGISDSQWGKVLATLANPPTSDGYTDSQWAGVRAVVGVVVEPMADLTDVEPGTLVELAGYIASNQPILRSAFVNAPLQPVPIVFAGSSTTAGQGASSSLVTGWAPLTAKALQGVYPNGGTESGFKWDTTGAFASGEVTTPGIHAYNIGEGGTTSANFFTSTERTNIGNLDPVAVFIMIGANDYSTGVNPTTYKANVATVLADLRTKCPATCKYVLIHSYQRLDVITPVYAWSLYREKLIELSQEFPADTVFLDVNDEFVAKGVPGTDPNNLIGSDDIHSTDAGHKLISDTVLADLEGIRPMDQWIFTQTSGPAVSIIVDKNFGRFYAPSVMPPTGPTLTFNVQGRKAAITSAAQAQLVKVNAATVWQGSSFGTVAGTRPPVQGTRAL